MERILARRLAALVRKNKLVGYTSTAIAPERMRWHYGEREAVGLFEIVDGTERQLWLVCAAWRGGDDFYVVVAGTDGYPIVEICDVVDHGATAFLRWSYEPRKRDTRNRERREHFIRHNGGCDVLIEIPRNPAELIEFFDELFRLASNRQSADLLTRADQCNEGFPEGRLYERRHLAHERSPALVKAAKAHALRTTGRLACSVCDFDFRAFYGPIGEGFIEAHHVTPVSELADDSRTRVEDLMIVCANCHRMLHISRPWLHPDELRRCVSQH